RLPGADDAAGKAPPGAAARPATRRRFASARHPAGGCARSRRPEIGPRPEPATAATPRVRGGAATGASEAPAPPLPVAAGKALVRVPGVPHPCPARASSPGRLTDLAECDCWTGLTAPVRGGAAAGFGGVAGHQRGGAAGGVGGFRLHLRFPAVCVLPV